MFLQIAVFLWFLWYIINNYFQHRRMPPGPFPLPILGNLHKLGFDPPFTMDKLWKTYGDVYRVTFPVGTIVIVNSGELAREALVTNKDDFAGRPTKLMYPMDVILEGKDVATADYDKVLISRRKLLKTALRGMETKLARNKRSDAVGELLGHIGSTEGRPFSLKDYLLATIVGRLWEGISSKKCSFGDPTLDSLVDLTEKITSLSTQGSCCQVLPFLRHFKSAFAGCVEETLKLRDGIFGRVIKDHRWSYKRGVVRDVIDTFLAAQGTAGDEEGDTGMEVVHLVMNILFGATATTTALTTWFFLYVAADSDLQSTLQKELDLVVGRDRLPCWEDIDKLAYLQSTVCEVMRHSLFMPLLIPHKTIRDTTINAYHLPKNTTVVFNLYRIYRDPKEWEQPTVFKSNRFLDADGKFLGWSKIPSFMPFGIGSRSCPGKDLGKMQVFVLAASLLHRFTIELPNKAPKPSLENSIPGSIRYPRDYKVIARKRL